MGDSEGDASVTFPSHICREDTECSCWPGYLTPSEDCPRHVARVYPPRCVECGRYMPLLDRIEEER